MILKINGNINKYYVQTLCMVFFPGATFSESEQPGIDVPEVTVDVYNDSQQTNVTAYVSIKLNDKLCEATALRLNEGYRGVVSCVDIAEYEVTVGDNFSAFDGYFGNEFNIGSLCTANVCIKQGNVRGSVSKINNAILKYDIEIDRFLTGC